MAFFIGLSFIFLPINKYIIPNDNPMDKVQMNVKIGLSVYPDSISKIEYAKYRPIMKNKVVVKTGKRFILVQACCLSGLSVPNICPANTPNMIKAIESTAAIRISSITGVPYMVFVSHAAKYIITPNEIPYFTPFINLLPLSHFSVYKQINDRIENQMMK